MLAILYGGGLRRAELCGLDLDDFDPGEDLITVRAGKGRRDRVVYLSKPACSLVKRWLSARGGASGPLFVPISSTGAVRLTRLRGEAVRYILQKRQRQAGLTGITPHGFRNYAEPRIMPSSRLPPLPTARSAWRISPSASLVARHNQRPSRKARSLSSGRKRPGGTSSGWVLASASSLSRMSAWM